MRLTPEQVAEEKKYLSEFKEMLWFGEHVLTSVEQDLFDTIEALQAENEQLQAQVARMREALRKAREAIRAAWSDGSASAAMDKASEALAAIDKAIGG